MVKERIRIHNDFFLHSFGANENHFHCPFRYLRLTMLEKHHRQDYGWLQKHPDCKIYFLAKALLLFD